MGGKRKTVSTIESHRFTVVRSAGPIEMWCKRCGKEVAMLKPEATASRAGVSPRGLALHRERRATLHRYLRRGAARLLIAYGFILKSFRSFKS